MPFPDGERGLARERTGLAWERSALAYAALGGLVLGVAARHEAPGLLALSAALVAVAVAAWHHGRRCYERAAVAPQARAVQLLALATAMAAIGAALAVVIRL